MSLALLAAVCEAEHLDDNQHPSHARKPAENVAGKTTPAELGFDQELQLTGLAVQAVETFVGGAASSGSSSGLVLVPSSLLLTVAATCSQLVKSNALAAQANKDMGGTPPSLQAELTLMDHVIKLLNSQQEQQAAAAFQMAHHYGSSSNLSSETGVVPTHAAAAVAGLGQAPGRKAATGADVQQQQTHQQLPSSPCQTSARGPHNLAGLHDSAAAVAGAAGLAGLNLTEVLTTLRRLLQTDPAAAVALAAQLAACNPDSSTATLRQQQPSSLPLGNISAAGGSAAHLQQYLAGSVPVGLEMNMQRQSSSNIPACATPPPVPHGAVDPAMIAAAVAAAASGQAVDPAVLAAAAAPSALGGLLAGLPAGFAAAAVDITAAAAPHDAGTPGRQGKAEKYREKRVARVSTNGRHSPKGNGAAAAGYSQHLVSPLQAALTENRLAKQAAGADGVAAMDH